MSGRRGRRSGSRTACALALALLGCDEVDYVAVYLGEGGLSENGGLADDTIAWCTCADLLAAAPVFVQTDAAEGLPASLAVRGGLHLEAPLVVDGSLVVAGGDLSATVDAGLEVGDDLWVGRDLSGAFSVTVADDAYVAGDVDVRALDVGGVLTLPPASTLAVAETLDTTAIRRSSVTIEPPCACADEDLRPAAMRLDEARGAPDVTALDDATYGAFAGATTLALDCGTYRVASIGGSGDLAIEVSGHAALHVEGALNVDGALEIRLAPGASLVLVVGDSVRAVGEAALGAPNAPERVELVADGAQISLEGGGTLHGSILAPAAELLLGPFELRGSLRARRIVARGTLDTTFVPPSTLDASCN